MGIWGQIDETNPSSTELGILRLGARPLGGGDAALRADFISKQFQFINVVSIKITTSLLEYC